jgi:hypothetical protein
MSRRTSKVTILSGYVVVDLGSPPGMEFDLEVYSTTAESGQVPTPPTTCSQPVASPTGDAGEPQIVTFTLPDTGLDPTAWVTIHVIAKPGSQCMTGEGYRLDITAE